MARVTWPALAFACVVLAGCVPVARSVVQSTPVVVSDHPAEWHWERREDAGELRTAIALYEQTLENTPSVELSIRLCRAYYLLADYFLENDPDAQAPLFIKGYECAMKGLKLQEDVAAAIGEEPLPSAEAIALVDLEHSGPLFWWAAHFGRWLEDRDLLSKVWYRGRFVTALERVQELDDEIFNGSVYMTWGAYYARTGRTKKAIENFEHGIRIAYFALPLRIAYAKECGLLAGDREFFVRQLERALEEEPPGRPEILPEFRLERKRARRLLEQVDALLPE